MQGRHVALRIFVDEDRDFLCGAFGQHFASMFIIGAISGPHPATPPDSRTLRCPRRRAGPSIARHLESTAESRTRRLRTWCNRRGSPPPGTAASLGADVIVR